MRASSNKHSLLSVQTVLRSFSSFVNRSVNMDSILCREIVKVTVEGCRHQHRYNVRCHGAKKFREDPRNCTRLVPIEMPLCGHKSQIPCHQEKEALKHPERCKALCNRQIKKCNHTCQRRCGECIKTTTKKNSGFVLSADNEDQLDHGICYSLCDKQLTCGHTCKELCHEGQISIERFVERNLFRSRNLWSMQ